MNYEGILEFHGTWRSYQARVLQNVSRYLSDDKIHIVAAPGSGKTTLGIELIKRLNANTLILAPSITIREQWAARIQEAFFMRRIRTGGLRLPEPEAAEGHYGRNLSGASQCNDPFLRHGNARRGYRPDRQRRSRLF